MTRKAWEAALSVLVLGISITVAVGLMTTGPEAKRRRPKPTLPSVLAYTIREVLDGEETIMPLDYTI